MSNFPDNIFNLENILVDSFDEDAFQAWRTEKYSQDWEGICSNLSIGIDDIGILWDDIELREIIMEAHQTRYPDTFTEEEYIESEGRQQCKPSG